MRGDTLTILVPIALLFGLMSIRIPIAFCLFGAGAVGILLLQGIDTAAYSVSTIPYSASAKYSLTVIPMFILMGLFVDHAGMLKPLFSVANVALRRIPGGLGLATITGCTIFGGISGSSSADAATMGRLSIGEMTKYGYDKAYAGAIVASAGTLAILIPPSIALVLYGGITSESVGELLLAGLLPGLVSASAYMVVVVIKGFRQRRVPLQATEAAPSESSTETAPLPEKQILLRVYSLFTLAVLFGLVIGGMYLGWFTATEAGAAGASIAFLLAVPFVVLSAPERRFKRAAGMAGTSLREASSLTAMIFALVVGATVFTQYLVLAGVPRAVSTWILELDVAPSLVVVLILLVLIPLGMFVDGLSILLIVTPLAYPIVTDLGFSGIWFGILLIKMIEIGLLTPPLGLNVFVVCGLFPGLRSEDVFRKVLPFIVADLVVTGLIFAFPAIVTVLPDLAAVRA